MKEKRSLSENKIVIIIMAVILAAAVLSVVINVIYQRTGIRGTYYKAVEMAVDGDVKGAEKLFESIEQNDFLDTEAFLVYCRAVQRDKDGDPSYGYENTSEMIFLFTTDEQNIVISEQIGSIIKHYEREQKRKEDHERLLKQLEESEQMQSQEETSEEQTDPPGSSATSRKYALENQGNLSGTYVPHLGSYGKEEEETTQKDPYDVDIYVHPDDFYYDHIDDFWDFEDAEEYYYEHHK